MHFISNELNSNEILNKFDKIHNDSNVIKIEIVNEMNEFFIILNSNINFF